MNSVPSDDARTTVASAVLHNYRTYHMDHNDRVFRVHDILAHDDEAAVALARDMSAGAACELWDGTRQIARLDREQS